MSNLVQEMQSLEQCHTLNDFVRPCARWVHAVPHLDPKYGGVSAVVPQLGSQLAFSENLAIDIAAFCDLEETTVLQQRPELGFSHWPNGRRAWLRNPGLRARFRNYIKHTDGLHIHGLWEGSTSIAAHTARRVGTPYVLSAHGMLDPWALANKRFKKLLYSALVERANVEGAACLHALTVSEARDYMSYGTRRPVAIVPNGVTLPATASSSPFLARFPELVDKRVVLFLGRIHPKKGVDLLIRSWTRLAAAFPDAVLVYAGPDGGSCAAIEKEARDSGIESQVLFTGMLDSEIKWSALASATCFVLPSYSEGLSVAALEAMGMGLPVIVSEHCHLPEVREFDAGWEIKAELPDLLDALQDVLTNTSATNRAIGYRGRHLVEKRFDWSVIAQQMAEVYRWVQGGPKPQLCDVLEVRP